MQVGHDTVGSNEKPAALKERFVLLVESGDDYYRSFQLGESFE